MIQSWKLLGVNHIAIAENKSKVLWQVTNNKRKDQNSGPSQPHLKLKGQITTDPEQMSKYKQICFINIAKHSDHKQEFKYRNLPQLPASNHDLTQLALTN